MNHFGFGEDEGEESKGEERGKNEPDGRIGVEGAKSWSPDYAA